MEPIALVFINILSAQHLYDGVMIVIMWLYQRIYPTGFHGDRWIQKIFIFNLLKTITHCKRLPVREHNMINVAGRRI